MPTPPIRSLCLSSNGLALLVREWRFSRLSWLLLSPINRSLSGHSRGERGIDSGRWMQVPAKSVRVSIQTYRRSPAFKQREFFLTAPVCGSVSDTSGKSHITRRVLPCNMWRDRQLTASGGPSQPLVQPEMELERCMIIACIVARRSRYSGRDFVLIWSRVRPSGTSTVVETDAGLPERTMTLSPR